jgi:hypothetical protein
MGFSIPSNLLSSLSFLGVLLTRGKYFIMVKEFLVGITSIKKILQDTLDYFFIEYD